MKDNIALGSIAGSIGGVIGMIFSYSMFLLGASPMSSIHLAASLVVIDVLKLTLGGYVWAIGFVSALIIVKYFFKKEAGWSK